MKEQFNRSPLVSELLSIMPSTSVEDTYRKTDLISMPEVIEEIAVSYRKIRMDIEYAGSIDKIEKLKEEPIFKLTGMIARVYPDVSAEPIRELLVEKYGFSDLEIKKFDEKDESNIALNRLFFDYIAYLEGSFSKSLIGRQFERPIPHRFNGKSRLQMIREDKGIEVLHHLRELSNGGGT